MNVQASVGSVQGAGTCRRPSTPLKASWHEAGTQEAAETAALLPALNAATYLLTLNAMERSFDQGAPMTSVLSETAGHHRHGNITYTMRDPKILCLEGRGKVGGHRFAESWQFDDQGLTIQGKVGKVAERIAMTSDDQGHVWLDGSIGRLAMHQTIVQDDSGTLIFDGTLGGLPFHQELSTLDQTAPDAASVLHDEGRLGTGTILFNDTIVGGDAVSLKLSGSGHVGAIPIQQSHLFSYSTPPGPAAGQPHPDGPAFDASA